MFGYVRAYKPELKVKELESYKGVYCGLCKALGREFTPLAKFILNYDFTFLAMLRLSLADKCLGFTIKRCSFNPLKRCRVYRDTNNILKSVAATAIIFFYYKLKDNLSDCGLTGKIACLFLLPFASLAHRKAKKLEPEVERAVASAMKQQARVEALRCGSIDEAAEPTARLLHYIAGMYANDKDEKEALERFGYCLGRWIYLIDALDDIKKDIKNKNFNPFVDCLKLDESNIMQKALQMLNVCVSEMVLSLNKLKLKRFGPIINNIVVYGLPRQQKLIAGKRNNDEKSL